MPKFVDYSSWIGKILWILLTSLCFCWVEAAAQQPQDRITGMIDESALSRRAGNVHPLAQREYDRGIVASETKLEKMVLLLSPSRKQQADLDQLTEAQQQPESAEYHHWLTPEEYGSRFGVSSNDLAQVTGWLERNGFVIEEVPASQRMVIFSGTAGMVANAFHTEMRQYAVPTKSGIGMHLANTSDPQIPAALAGVVHGVLSLHDFRHSSAISTRRALKSTSPEYSAGGGNYFLSPSDYATIYDINPLYGAGTKGTGVTIAIVSRSNIHLSDVEGFRTFAGLPAKLPTITLVSTDPGFVSGDEDEAILDVEWSGAVGQGATVNMVVAASTATTDGVDLSAQYIVNHASGQVMSTSFGSCEQYLGATEMAFYNSIWQQAASEGISAFVSSGDSGASGCEGGSSATGTMKAVNGLCSSPYATCVGGTELNESGNGGGYWATNNSASNGSARSYIPEKAWNDSALDGGSGLWGTGGGASVVYAQPSWQRGVSGASATNGMRGVPDVSLSASGAHDGYLIEENGALYVIGGTSAASPSFAGLMSLVVQAQGGMGQGNANPILYGLLKASETPFHATPTGNNSVPDVPGYSATGVAYNLATGLGSVDANVLVNEWGAGSETKVKSVDFTLTASSTSGSVQVGKSTTFTLSAAAVGSTQPRVALTASAPTGVNVTMQSTSITPGAPTTVTVTGTSAAPSGAQNIVFTGSDSSGSGSVTYALTVVQPPLLSLVAASSSTSVSQGKTGTAVFTVATGGSLSGAVNLAVSGLPSGVTASWSNNGFTPSSTATSTNTTLTLTATRDARVTTSTLTVTATAGGLSSQQTLSVQVLQASGLIVAVSSNAVSMQSMGTAALTLTATPQGGWAVPTNAAGSSVTLTSALPTGITSSWSAPRVSSSGAVSWTLTLSGSNTAVASTAPLQFTVQAMNATGGVVCIGTASSRLTVQLTAPTLAVTAASSSLTIAQGASGTEHLTFTGGGSYRGTIRLSVTGLPSGVTASWSTNPVMLRSNSGTATLMLTASSTAQVKSGAIVVTATGDGLSEMTHILIAVTKSTQTRQRGR